MKRTKICVERLKRIATWRKAIAHSIACAAALALALAVAPALAQTFPRGGTEPAPAAGGSAVKNAVSAAAAVKGGRRVSKFEARKIRYACRGRANESGLKGAEREAYLVKCFFGRASRKNARNECAAYGAAKGLEKTALQDFVRECVKERTRQKD